MRSIYLVLLIFCLAAACTRAFAEPLTGTVIGPSGQPVSGAQVSVYWMNSSERQPALQAICASDGSFSVDVPESTVQGGRCIVTASGLSVGGGYIALGQPNVYQLALPAPVSGTVVDSANKPVSGATVKIRYVSSGRPTGPSASGSMIFTDIPGESRLTTLTDKKGEYSFADLPQNSTVGIELLDPRFATVTQSDKAGQPAAPIVARSAADISGKLNYDGGGPAAGIEVEAQPVGAGDGWAAATTDAQGRFTLAGLSTGAYNVFVEFDKDSGWVAPADQSVAAVEGTSVAAPDIVAVHGATIAGLVTDSDSGKPVSGAMIGCYGPQRPSSSAAIAEATSDEHGQYSLRVAPGANKVYMSGTPDKYLSVTGDSMTAVSVADGDVKQVNFQLKAGLSIVGTATDPSGKPVPDVTVSVWRAGDANNYDPFGNPQADTDKDGGFTINKLSPGAYSIHVSGPWKIVSSDEFQAPAAGPVSLMLSPVQLASMSGKAVDPDGKPIAGVQLNFMVLTPIGNGMSTGQNETETSDESGNFTLSDLKPDNDVTAAISKDGYSLISGGKVTSTDGRFTITDVVMAALSASVSGVICDEKGAPIAEAWVIAASNAGPVRPVHTDPSGRFTLAGLTPGPVDIVAAKGSLAGRATLTAAASEGGASSSLSVQPTPPLKSADTVRGYAILSDLRAAAGTGNYYAAGSVTAELGAYDPDAAVRLLSSTGQAPSDTDIMQVVLARAQLNPRAAAAWGIPRIGVMQDAGAKAESAVTLGLMVAATDPASARTLFTIAKSAAAAAPGGQFGQYVALQLPALAAALHLPETQSLLNQAIAQCRREPHAGNGQTSMMGQLAAFTAAADPHLAQQVVDQLPADQRDNARRDMITSELQINPSASVQLAKTMGSVDPADFNYGKVADQAIEEMGKTDPQGALSMAESVQSTYSQAIVLADAADFLPMSQAADLYRKAAVLTLSASGSRATPAMIAAKAWLRDKVLGRELFEIALKNCKAADPMEGRSPQPVPDFAFYYARIDPAYSRTLLEKAYANDSLESEPNHDSSKESDAIAMAAVDVDRALQMAYAISDTNARLDGVRKIAQYVLAPTSVRSTMPFDRWNASDTWIPGTPTMW